MMDGDKELLYAIENMKSAVAQWPKNDLARPHMELIFDAAEQSIRLRRAALKVVNRHFGEFTLGERTQAISALKHEIDLPNAAKPKKIADR